MLESIFGKPPPPPPANVRPRDAGQEPKTTFGQKLEAHRAEPNCAGCHRRDRPAGPGVRQLRRDRPLADRGGCPRRLGANPPIDAESANFPTAASSPTTLGGLKKLLLDEKDKFAIAFLEKLATYALRRGMTFRDRAELKKLAEQSKSEGYKLATLIESFGAE